LGGGCHDAPPAAACRSARGAPEAKLVVAWNLSLDRDRCRLSQGQSICRADGVPGTRRCDCRPVGAIPAPRRDDRLDVSRPRSQPGGRADRRGRIRGTQELAVHSRDHAAAREPEPDMINFNLFPSRKLASSLVRLFITRSLAVLVALVLIL